jgi:hypothetical protein
VLGEEIVLFFLFYLLLHSPNPDYHESSVHNIQMV